MITDIKARIRKKRRKNTRKQKKTNDGKEKGNYVTIKKGGKRMKTENMTEENGEKYEKEKEEQPCPMQDENANLQHSIAPAS